MLLVTTTKVLGERFGLEKAIEMIADAGFDGLDYSAFNDEASLAADDYRAYAKKLKAKAENCGIKFCQAHASFPMSLDKTVFDSDLKLFTVRAIEAAAIMGAEIIVVHPVQHLEYVYNIEELFEMNMKFYRELIPLCEKFGIKIAAENMFRWDEKRRCNIDSTCASPEEFARYLDTLNSPWITGCLDIGHCGVCSREPQEVIRRLGSDRITCLHVHDNNYVEDLHTLPYTGDLDWKAICRALKEIGYKGNFTYEADKFLAKYPNEFLPTALKFMHDTGRFLINEI